MSLVHHKELVALSRRIASIESRIGGMNYDMREIVRAELVENSNVVEQAQMQFGLYTALCVDTIDIWKQNRVRFFSPLFHDQNMRVDQLPFAQPISSLGGFDDSGVTWVPPAGSILCILFENGSRQSPYYVGTTWNRSRGPDGEHNFGFNVPEYYKIYEGKRKGYLVGANDGSQNFPPWNTENYNGYDLSSVIDFAANPEAQRLITYPNIYGFKTPEKHMIKMVDGDPKCNRKWKRFEIMSSCGNYIMLKDDHLHYAGQWAHPLCGGNVIVDGETSCVEDAYNQNQIDRYAKGFGSLASNPDYEAQTDAQYNADPSLNLTPIEGKKLEEISCEEKVSNRKIIGGHPRTPSPKTKYFKSQVGANPYFKHRQECRPYRGSLTPQNTSCDLPQSGIQIQSISGHAFVMDDSVEEPSGEPTWDREFDFGCNNKYLGRTYWKSATGHSIEMSDVEADKSTPEGGLRGKENYIRIKSATGNKIELNDHTESQPNCVGCPPNIAGKNRGILLQSTSNHVIQMSDEGNEQCGPCRVEGGAPQAKAKKAFVRIRTGYGLEMSFNDDSSQEETQQQSIQIFAPQKDNKPKGPHIHRYQEARSGPGLVFLRVGGNYVCYTTDNHYTVVGEEDNPSNLIEYVTNVNLVYSKAEYVNVSDALHLFLNKRVILLLAGQDCPIPDSSQKGPCPAPVLVYQGGCIKISDRIIGSCSQDAPLASIFMMHPFIKKCNGE